MHITKWGEYGTLCSLYLAKKTLSGITIVGASEIASAHDIALDYTQQILQRLRKGGIILSVRGSKGGYKLSRPPETINLLEVLNATEGSSFETICERNPLKIVNRCDIEDACGLRATWKELQATIDEVLSRYDLKTLAESVKCSCPVTTLR